MVAGGLAAGGAGAVAAGVAGRAAGAWVGGAVQVLVVMLLRGRCCWGAAAELP